MTGLLKKGYVYFCTALILLCSCLCHAQGQQAQQQGQQQIIQFASPHPPAKIAARSEIDAKRMGVNVNSEDALPRSREFLRVDSTYYVGWLYEGAYKYNHAADYLGFKNASVPLEHALRLLERDYKKQLATRTDNLMLYYPAYKFDIDYTLTALYLMNCYSNMDEAEKVYLLLRRVLHWNFQRDFYMDAYNYLGWTVHRNRFYTSAKYPFLKNSIKENEALANRMLDSGLHKIKRDKVTNAHIFPPGYEANDILGVYHYKSILYSYSISIDSAEYYFNLLRNSPIFPHNNYATFRAICGDFRTAESEYKKSVSSDGGDKRLQEWAYYSSIIDNYKAQPKTGVALMKDMIRSAGSTPGFGWYNIALARCMLYDGQVEEANRYADKAASFKELHIGTTLGQSQYDFSIQLLKLINKDAAFQQQEFENRNWWYNPRVLANMTSLKVDKYLQQFLIINQFSQNPERDMVIYKLFSTESTVSWDEIWYLIKDFSTSYFLDKFKKEALTDDRKYVRKYFQLFVALLEIKEGNYQYARTMLDGILRSPDIDVDFEKLFIARVFQAQAECAKERKDNVAYDDWMYRLYATYPQLVPYTGLQMNMNLHMSGAVDKEVADRLKACNINWVTDLAIPAPDVYVVFVKNGNKKDIQYFVTGKGGNVLVNRQSFACQKADEAGVSLGYRIFNIGGKEPDQPKDKGK
ncbi:MAG: hypothetical protein P4L41_02585 [Flavipsychrobacter sp.]|nr:hypothetical protein [Flavipsychrobacter sp.]